MSRALKLDPNLPEVSNNLGSLFVVEQRHREAIEAYKRATEVSALDLESRRNLGHLLLLSEKNREAAEQLQLALALAPTDLDTLFDLALAYRQLGQRKESLTFFETFIELASADGSRSEQVIQAQRAVQKLRYP